MLFNEDIIITGTREGGRQFAATLPACVVDDGVPSDAIESQLSAACDQYTFFVSAADWVEVAPPHIGDEIIRENDARFRVTRVARLGSCFSLNCRGR